MPNSTPQRAESIARKQTFAGKVVLSSWIEHLLCLVPSLHQARPMQVSHHRLVFQYPPFTRRKCSLWKWPTVACNGWPMVDGLRAKAPLPQTPSRNFSYTPSRTPFISLSAKNILVIICSDCHISLHCRYFKSSLKATRMPDHRKKLKKNSQQLHNHFL